MKFPLSLRAFGLCVLIGIGLGVTMIATHTGPGLSALTQPSTPETRNDTRREVLAQLADALARYATDHNGTLPTTIPPTATEICSSRGPNCETVKLVDLSFLVTQGDYMGNIPSDPSGGPGRWTTGFTITRLPDGRMQLTAPRAETGASISVTQ